MKYIDNIFFFPIHLDVLFEDDEDNDEGNIKLPQKIKILMTSTSSKILLEKSQCKKGEALELLNDRIFFSLPPENASPIGRGQWRTAVVRNMYNLGSAIEEKQ